MPVATLEKFTDAAKVNVEALTQSGNATIAGFQELAKAYQALATKNAEKLTAAIQALSSVKNPNEFVELQQKLIRDAVEAAVADSKEIAGLTSSIFTAAFEPVKKQIETATKAASKK